MGWLLFSHSVLSNSLQLHGLYHARLPCPSPSPRVCSNSCPLSLGRYLTISSSAAPCTCDQVAYVLKQVHTQAAPVTTGQEKVGRFYATVAFCFISGCENGGNVGSGLASRIPDVVRLDLSMRTSFSLLLPPRPHIPHTSLHLSSS